MPALRDSLSVCGHRRSVRYISPPSRCADNDFDFRASRKGSWALEMIEIEPEGLPGSYTGLMEVVWWIFDCGGEITIVQGLRFR